MSLPLHHEVKHICLMFFYVISFTFAEIAVVCLLKLIHLENCENIECIINLITTKIHKDFSYDKMK
jgi:hypothetical protein